MITLTCVLANHAGLTSLAAQAHAGETNLKVTDVAGMVVGQAVIVDPGGTVQESGGTIVSIGTTGFAGTGVDISTPLTLPHPNATVVGFTDA